MLKTIGNLCRYTRYHFYLLISYNLSKFKVNLI